MIAGSHIEIHTCEVALVFVIRLKHARASTALPCDGVAHSAHAIAESAHINHAERIVALGRVGRAVAGEEVHEVGSGKEFLDVAV